MAQAQYNARLRKEFTKLQKSKPCGIEVSLPSDNFHEWDAIIPGPEQSFYKGGKFKVRVNIPEDYPLSPPIVHFMTPIYHVNVSKDGGQVCLSFLHQDNWLATATMEQIFSSLFSLLIKPEVSNAFDHDILNQYTHYPWDYEAKAKACAQKAKGL